MKWLSECLICHGWIECKTDEPGKWNYECQNANCHAFYGIQIKVAEHETIAVCFSVMLRYSQFQEMFSGRRLTTEHFFGKCFLCQGDIVKKAGLSVCGNGRCRAMFELHTREVYPASRPRVLITAVAKVAQHIFEMHMSTPS